MTQATRSTGWSPLLLYAALLWTAVVLSVFKPGKRTRWAAVRGEAAAGKAPVRTWV